jgi:hypothetical protein
LRSSSGDATSAAAEVRRVILPLDSILILSAKPASGRKQNCCVPPSVSPALASATAAKTEHPGEPTPRIDPAFKSGLASWLGDEDVALALPSIRRRSGNVPNFPCCAYFVKQGERVPLRDLLSAGGRSSAEHP